MLFLALRQANCKLDPSFQIVHVQRDQRVPGAHHFADQLADLGAAHQKLSGSDRIRADMG